MLTIEEEVSLSQRIQDWDLSAINKLVEANLSFVVSIAKEYQYNWLPLDDLISEGNFWLIEAAKKFDPTRGFKFISYAVHWIRSYINAALYDKSRIINVPQNQLKLWYAIKKVEKNLSQILHRYPTEQEIYDTLIDKYPHLVNLHRSYKSEHLMQVARPNISEKDILPVSNIACNQIFSIDKDIPGWDNLKMMDTFSFLSQYSEIYSNSFSIEIEDTLWIEVESVLSFLNDSTEKDIIKMFFGLKPYDKAHSYDEIGEKFWKNRETIRLWKNKIISKLKARISHLD